MGLGMMAITLSFQSCWDDDDDCPRHVICPVEQPNALVTVKPNADNTAFRMQLNDSTQLWPVNMRQSPFGSKEVRALVNYRKPTEEELEKGGIFGGISCVYVNWIDSILTKPMIEGFGSAEENLQKYGSDPLEIIDDWVTLVEDGYLTLRIRTRWGGNVKHIVNLVHRTDVNTPNYFTLYHNAKGDVNGRVGELWRCNSSWNGSHIQVRRPPNSSSAPMVPRQRICKQDPGRCQKRWNRYGFRLQ